MEDVRLPSTLRIIENSAFVRCKNLKEIKLPDRLEKIGASSFMESGLKELVLPKSVREMGPYTFASCK